MTWQNIALGLAGVIGSATAVVHGVLTQRLMVRPIAALFLSHGRISAPVRRLVPLLLQFSTVVWFGGGLALIAASLWFDRDVRRATGLLVGATYLFGALGNLWGTRGRHPGWMLMAAAVVLIAVALGMISGPSSSRAEPPACPERKLPRGGAVEGPVLVNAAPGKGPSAPLRSGRDDGMKGNAGGRLFDIEHEADPPMRNRRRSWALNE